MIQEKPAGVSVLDEYRQRAAERKGRRSIDVLPANTPATPAERDPAGPSRKSKKREMGPRELLKSSSPPFDRSSDWVVSWDSSRPPASPLALGLG